MTMHQVAVLHRRHDYMESDRSSDALPRRGRGGQGGRGRVSRLVRMKWFSHIKLQTTVYMYRTV